MSLISALGLTPSARMLGAAPALAGLVPTAASASSGAAVKGGAEAELVTREFAPFKTKYGDLKVAATLKIQATGQTGSGNGGFAGSVTSKDKSDGRATGTKKTFSYDDFADRELLGGFTLKDFSVGFESEISGLDLSLSGLVKFTLVTNVFEARGQGKLMLLTIKGGQEITGPGLEVKVAPAEFTHRIGAVEAKVLVEYKASFTVDAKKVGAEVGKKVLEKVARQALEKEAKRRGLGVLGRKAAETVLKDLGPLAAAFGVGLDIGELLNQYTIAPEVAKVVIDEILGDFAERYHDTDTLGKLWLVSKNSPRIVAALVAGGVAGAFAGMTDLLLFKLLGLDRLKDFAIAFDAFAQGLTLMKQVAGVPVQVVGGAILHRALVIGIKFNPKHALAHHGTLDPVIASIFAKIHPIYKVEGGLDKLLGVHLKDTGPDPANFLKFAAYAHRNGMNKGVAVDMGSPATLAASLLRLPLSEYLRFLEANNLMACNVKVDDNLDPDALDPKLLDELYG